ncbi:MAG: sodium:alanine symporter family protein, partial [Clostridia bacterium]|nr:sodium:alanine symporter family protein [Clostridia bacterium]
MESISNFLMPIVVAINTYMSDYILIFLLVGIGLFYTIRTKFVQVRCFGEGMKRVFGNLSLKGGKQSGGLSSFQALATAIAAQVGTGNIVGACGAIMVGGPGAIFWMWIIAFFGMATIYAEAVLAQSTKIVKEDGSVLGGPVYYIKKAFGGGFGKFLAVFFAVAITLALGFMGAMVQSNSIAGSISTATNNVVAPWMIGLALAAICAFIFIGGIQRIASVAEKIVPIMAVIYLVLGVVILGINVKLLPETFAMIFKFAFTPQAIIGGTLGAAIKAAISQG